MQPREQWAMSASDNVYGMSLPEVHDIAIEEDFTSWKKEYEKSLPAFEISAFEPSMPTIDVPNVSSGTGVRAAKDLDAVYGGMLTGMKEKADKALGYGYGLKTVAQAGEFFSKVLTSAMEISNANRAYRNKKQSVENQMEALDNQVQYYKNQIADKFATTMARNAMTMAAKNLRVTAGNLLEETKDAAYDATKDIATLESNANLKKIALRSEAKQAKVARNLTKQLVTSGLINSAAKLGLTVAGGFYTGAYDKLFSVGTESLNESVYGG